MVAKRKTNSFAHFAQSGFSLLEMIVVTAIMTAIVSVIMVNYAQMRKTESLQLSRDSVQGVLRQAQNSALSGQPYSGGGAAQDHGVKISTALGSYEIFVEQQGTSARQILETLTLPNSVSISNLKVTRSGTVYDATEAEIKFFPPFGEIKVTARNGATTLFTEQPNIIVNFNYSYQGSAQTRSTRVDGVSGRID